MNIKKQWVKPVMVTEQFTPDDYVAICAMPAQFLYADGLKKSGSSYSQESDGYFQDARHFTVWWQQLIIAVISFFTGNTYETDGEFMGIRTTDNPSQKGTVATFRFDYPIYGSPTQLTDGAQYTGPNLQGSIKRIGNSSEYYIQGNMS